MRKKLFGLSVFLISLMCSGCTPNREKALENEQAYRQIGINKMEEGDYEGAVKAFQKALDQSVAIVEELEIDICYYKAAAQYKSGDVQGAEDTYTALIDFDNKNGEAYYLRGTMRLLEGQDKKALEDYYQAVEASSLDGKLYNQIAEQLFSFDLQTEAEKILKMAVELTGKEPKDYRERGYSYYLLGDYKNARTNLDKAAMEDDEAVFYLAKMLEANGDTQQAEQLYKTYVESHSQDTETLNMLGEKSMQDEDYEQALQFFQTALKNENIPNEQTIRQNEILVLEYLRDFKTARERMKDYVKLYPEDEQALREYEFLKTR